jgi:hypothetical protein
MDRVETEVVQELTKSIGGKKNWAQFWSFKKKFYENFTVEAPKDRFPAKQ